MSIVRMDKVRLLVHEDAADDVLALLHERGVLEFTPVEDARLHVDTPEEFAYHRRSARLDAAIAFLAPYAQGKRGLAAMVEGTAVRLRTADIARLADAYDDDMRAFIADVLALQKEINEIQKTLRTLRKDRAALLPWRGVPLRPGAAVDTAYTRTLWIVRQRARTADQPHRDLAMALEAAGAQYYILSVDARHAVVTWHASVDATEIIAAQGYDTVTLPSHAAATVAAALDAIASEERALRDRLARAEVRAQKMAERMPRLQALSDYMLWQRERHDVRSGAHRSRNVLVYEGWCPHDAYDALVRALADRTPLASLERIAPADGEQPPVEIANKPIVRPFETITRLYGMPGARDVDPTPYLAGFFFVFFGFCLTDVGYGAVLAALTGYMLWRYRVAPTIKPMLQLLFLGGIASLIAGLFFGGYFGADMAHMPQWLRAIQVFDPIANPIPVFLFALALGVVHVMVGLIVAIVRGVQYGEGRAAVLDHAPWLALFVALIIFGAAQLSLIALPHAVWGVYAALALIVVTQGRTAPSLPGKVFKGVTSLYDSVSYFADILSYSRLLALGLATSALAFAINLIAGMVAGPAGERTIVGLFFAGVVLVVGHLFNLAINAFGAFIHSARLQFVEFFGKFLTGTGRPFAPWRRAQRYVLVEDAQQD